MVEDSQRVKLTFLLRETKGLKANVRMNELNVRQREIETKQFSDRVKVIRCERRRCGSIVL